MQAGLAGDRTAFPSEIRFTKSGGSKTGADLNPELHLLMMAQSTAAR